MRKVSPSGTKKVNKQTTRQSKSRNKDYDDFFENPAKSGEKSSQQATQQAKASAAALSKSKTTTLKKPSTASSKRKSSDLKSTAKKQKRKPAKKKGIFYRIIRALTILLCTILAWCLYAYYVVMFNEQQPLVKADAGIVLGAALWNNEPSPALKERLEHAMTLYNDGLVDVLILSGGSPQGYRGLTEAEGMKTYLMNKGIPEHDLLLEGQSSDTYENLTYSKRVMERAELNTAIIISHKYHTKRAKEIANYAGYSFVQTSGVKTTVLNESYHYTREMLAYSKWQISKVLLSVGIEI